LAPGGLEVCVERRPVRREGGAQLYQKQIFVKSWKQILDLMPIAISIFGPLSQTHFPERSRTAISPSRFGFVFQVIQVISSGKFFSAEKVDLSFNSET